MVFRTPLLLGSLCLALQSPAAWRWIVLFQSRYNPMHAFYCAPFLEQDCFLYIPTTVLYLPNLARLLAYLAGIFLFLEAWNYLRPAEKMHRPARAIGCISAALVVMPATCFLRQLQGPLERILPLWATAVLLLWVFLLANMGWPPLEQLYQRNRWIPAALEWTFPFSDLYFFRWHRMRAASKTGPWRFLPVGIAAMLLLFALVHQASLLQHSLKTERLPISVYRPQMVLPDDRGIWYSETATAFAGLWRYDFSSKKSSPHIRADDLRSFVLEQGRFYLYDAFYEKVFCADVATKATLWEAAVPSSAGRCDVLWNNGLLWAVGEKGYLAVYEPGGAKKAETSLSVPLKYPRPLPGGELAVARMDTPSIEIFSDSLQKIESIPLPVTVGGGSDIPVVTGIEYDPGTALFWIASSHGRLYRYEWKTKRWLAPGTIPVGVSLLTLDAGADRLVTYQHVQGLIRFHAPGSGAPIVPILSNVFGSVLQLFPSSSSGILCSRGASSTSVIRQGGIYRFSYSTRQEQKP